MMVKKMAMVTMQGQEESCYVMMNMSEGTGEEEGAAWNELNASDSP